MSSTYLQAQSLVAQLSLPDQARLLEYLSGRLARIVSADTFAPGSLNAAPTTGWEAFFQVGDELMHTDRPDSETLTAALLAMRR